LRLSERGIRFSNRLLSSNMVRQLSSPQKALLAIGIVAVIAAAIQVVRFHSKGNLADDVRRVLDADIQAGSTRTQIESYLDSAHVGYMYAAGTHFQDGRSSLIALAKGARKGHLLPTTNDEVQIRFRFDDSEHLINYDVRAGADRYNWR
jgi:hypothetical protein